MGLAHLSIPIKVMGSEKRHLFQGKSVFSRLDGSSAAEDGCHAGRVSKAAGKASILCFQIRKRRAAARCHRVRDRLQDAQSRSPQDI
jgi:hypothetical protein